MTDSTLFPAEQRLHANELLDCYGALLTKKQQTAAELYYRDDLSLSEISDMLGISRQGVLDSLHRSLRILEDAEAKLGFLAKEQHMTEMAEQIKQIAADPYMPEALKQRLEQTIGEF